MAKEKTALELQHEDVQRRLRNHIIQIVMQYRISYSDAVAAFSKCQETMRDEAYIPYSGMPIKPIEELSP